MFFYASLMLTQNKLECSSLAIFGLVQYLLEKWEPMKVEYRSVPPSKKKSKNKLTCMSASIFSLV